MSFGSRLKERREALGLKQSELGKMLGVTGSAIGNYENGVSSPKADVLYKVFDVLQCDANYLFQDEIIEQTKKAPSISDEALRLAKDYDDLDEWGKAQLRSVADNELKRVEAQLMHEGSIIDLRHGVHVIKVAGRDGSFRELHLTEDQVKEFQEQLDQLPDAPDSL